MQKNTEKCFLQAFLRSTIVFYVNESLYLCVSCKNAKFAKAKLSLRCARRMPEERCDSSLALREIFSALLAPGLQKPNFLRAARARYHRKRVTQSSVAKYFAALCRENFRHARLGAPKCFVSKCRSTFVFFAKAPRMQKQNFLCPARARVAKAKFSPRCARQIPEKTGDLV